MYVPSHLLYDGYLGQLIFNPEDGGNMFLQKSVHIRTTQCCVPEDGNIQSSVVQWMNIEGKGPGKNVENTVD